VLDQLRQLTGASQEARPFYRCLTGPELETLAREPLITLGAHTISHCDLNARTKAEQQAEISGSKEQLEKIIGAQSNIFPIRMDRATTIPSQFVPKTIFAPL
jgi:peptidoglycan/xylan/chitin deacetylase (PgdA/CDA1 family)